MKINLDKLFKNNNFVVILSIILAIISWFLVAIYIHPNTTKTVKNVPVNLNIEQTPTGKLGLSIISDEQPTVDIMIEGKRYSVASLSASDFVITPSLTNVSEAGVYDVKLVGTKNNPMGEYEIIEINPERISIRVDRIKSKKLKLETEVTGVEIEEGFVLAKKEANVPEITVTGPEAQIDKITSVVAKGTSEGVLNDVKNIDAALIYYDADGKEFVPQNIKVSESNIYIVMSVFKEKNLPVRCDFLNAPTGVDTTKIPISYSPSTLKVAGPKDVIDKLEEITVGYVDLKTTTIGQSYIIDVEFTSGIVSLDNISQVECHLTDSMMSTKQVTVTNIIKKNQPDGFDITIETTSIKNVVMVGITDQIKNLDPTSLIAEVDLTAVQSAGKTKIPVTIRQKDGAVIWGYGDYTVIVNVKAV